MTLKLKFQDFSRNSQLVILQSLISFVSLEILNWLYQVKTYFTITSNWRNPVEFKDSSFFMSFCYRRNKNIN